MKSAGTQLLLCSVLLICFPSCRKVVNDSNPQAVVINPKTSQFIEYIIRKGEHYTGQRFYQSVQYVQLNFVVRFDSTAIYKTLDPANQEDINKLYGFSDNDSTHQQFSARFGWNWTREALRLYAYIYNNGERTSQEITSVEIGKTYTCSIRVSGNRYFFYANNFTVEMPRASATPKGSGYKLFPYFGGDETSPHDIHIWIKEL